MAYQFHITIGGAGEVEQEVKSVPRRSKRIRDRNAQRISPHQSTAAASKFIPEAGDDLLLEIFLRLSDAPSTIRCSTVCKRWRSLVSAPQFVCSFARRRRSSGPLPYYALFLRYWRPLIFTNTPSGSNFPPPNRLEFLPWPYDMKASSEDLLLFTYSPTPLSIKYCV